MKNNINEINIMPGIDFKANQKRINDKKKKKRLINTLLNVGIAIVLLVLVVTVLIANKKMTDSAMESCQNKGNSYEYCINHV